MSASAGKRDVVPLQPYTEEFKQSPSPRKRKRWDDEEEEALEGGVEKYGEGRWRAILDDDEFGPVLRNRRNVDLKDKWRNIAEKQNRVKPGKGTKPAVAETSTAAVAAAAAAAAATAAVGDGDSEEAETVIPADPRPLEILRSRLPQILGNLHGVNAEFRQCANVLPLQRTLQRSCALEESLKNACEMAGIDITDVSGRAENKRRRRKKTKRRKLPPAESPGGIHFQLLPFRTEDTAQNSSESESDESDGDEDKKIAGEDTSEKKKPAAPAQGGGDKFSPLQTRGQRRAGTGGVETRSKHSDPTPEANDDSFFSKTLRTFGLR